MYAHLGFLSSLNVRDCLPRSMMVLAGPDWCWQMWTESKFELWKILHFSLKWGSTRGRPVILSTWGAYSAPHATLSKHKQEVMEKDNSKNCYIGSFETESVIMWLSPSSCHQDSKYFLCLTVKAHSSSPLCLPYNTLPLAGVMCCLLPLCGWKCSSSMQHKNCSPSLLNLLQNGKISFCERRKCQ